ncbi:cysteine hydrolase family protein [Aspergillus crustosus]
MTILSTFALLGGSMAAATTPGYSVCTPSTVTNSSSLSFGQNYAVLNLDLISALVASVSETEEGQKWINSTATWINAVHHQSPPPLCIYTRIYCTNSKAPEVTPDVPFYQAVAALGNVYDAFAPLEDYDVVLRKSRYYAGDGKSLEEILRTQKIDTVIISGIRTSGVLLITALRLFDLDYNVYVITNNTIEMPPDAPCINDAILQGILPKLPVNVITVEQAIQALEKSGPTAY